MKPVSKFFSDMVKSVSSSGVQLLITMVTTPLMTRLYDPAAYSAFGVIHAMAMVVVGVGLLSLPNAYPIEKDPEKRTELVRTMLLMLLILVILCIIAAAGMAVTGTFGFDTITLFLLPVLVLTFGIRQILVSVATECANFTSLSVGQIVEPACSRTGSIALGAIFGGHPVFILASVAVGHLATAVAVARMVLKNSFHQWRSLFVRAKLVETLKRYADFAVYQTSSTQAQPFALLGIQLIIVSFFSHDVAGHYILAISILTLPASVVALATAPVVYRDFIETERTNPKELAGYLKRASALYLLAGAVILSPIFFFGEELFQFVFGDVWAESGRIASTLSVAYVGAFALVGVQSIFRVTRRLKTQFFIEVFTAAIALIVVALSFKHMNIETSIFYLSVIWSIRNVILLCACIVVTNEHADSAIRIP